MQNREYQIPSHNQVVFVSDFFVDDYIGGAELTMEAIIDASPFSVFKLHSRSLTPQLVEANKDKYWVLVNFTQCSHDALITLATSGAKFSIIECDYKYCKYRSPQLHLIQEKIPCACNKSDGGRFIKGLMKRSQKTFFMSETQMETYKSLFPTMNKWNNLDVQISTWSQKHLETFERLRKSRKPNGKWVMLGGGSWIKNQDATARYLKEAGREFDVLGGLSYDLFIETLSNYEGLCFHPLGFDTCPRLVVEAKLMGLELDLNDFVQHKDESWFADKSPEELNKFLMNRPNFFWNQIDV